MLYERAIRLPGSSVDKHGKERTVSCDEFSDEKVVLTSGANPGTAPACRGCCVQRGPQCAPLGLSPHYSHYPCPARPFAFIVAFSAYLRRPSSVQLRHSPLIEQWPLIRWPVTYARATHNHDCSLHASHKWSKAHSNDDAWYDPSGDSCSSALLFYSPGWGQATAIWVLLGGPARPIPAIGKDPSFMQPQFHQVASYLRNPVPDPMNVC